MGFLAAGCCVLFACAAPADRDLLAEAEAFCLDQRYGEALPMLQELLLREPANAGAHYYLGRCFMLREDFRPRMAVGEFETALRLFETQGGESPIERFTPGYFEMICHLDSAKATIFEVQNLVSKGVAPQFVRPVIERGKKFTEAARVAQPDAVEVASVYKVLAAMSYEHGRPGRQRREPSVRSL